METQLDDRSGEHSKVSQRERQPNDLDLDQIKALEHYYDTVNKKPKRPEKTELANRYNINPFRVNSWFQARRNKDYTAERKRKLAMKERAIRIGRQPHSPATMKSAPTSATTRTSTTSAPSSAKPKLSESPAMQFSFTGRRQVP